MYLAIAAAAALALLSAKGADAVTEGCDTRGPFPQDFDQVGTGYLTCVDSLIKDYDDAHTSSDATLTGYLKASKRQAVLSKTDVVQDGCSLDVIKTLHRLIQSLGRIELARSRAKDIEDDSAAQFSDFIGNTASTCTIEFLDDFITEIQGKELVDDVFLKGLPSNKLKKAKVFFEAREWKKAAKASLKGLRKTLQEMGERSIPVAPTNFPSGPWQQLGQDIEDVYGRQVALSKDARVMAVTAYGGRVGFVVRLYEYDATVESGWKQLGKDIVGKKGGETFGSSVSLNTAGNVVAIGASNLNGAEAGRAVVYQYKSATSSWEQLGQSLIGNSWDQMGNSGLDGSGFSVSLSGEGNVLAVGTRAYENPGQVRAFQYDSDMSSWIPLGQELVGSDHGDILEGWTPSINNAGNVIAIASRFSYSRTPGSGVPGQVRVYEYNSDASEWEPKGQEFINDEADFDGFSVSLNDEGNVLAVGGYSPSSYALGGAFMEYTYVGKVRVFQYNARKWTQIGQSIDGEELGDNFGGSLSLSSAGDVLAAGSHNYKKRGRVQVFRYTDSVWSKVGGNLNGEKKVGDRFGYDVSLSGNGTIVGVGVPLQHGRGNARVYTLN